MKTVVNIRKSLKVPLKGLNRYLDATYSDIVRNAFLQLIQVKNFLNYNFGCAALAAELLFGMTRFIIKR